VSPQFVIASQKGAVVPIEGPAGYPTFVLTHQKAAHRCATYYESQYPAGSWRVPTIAELLLIRKLQNDTNSAIKDLFAVLPGSPYGWWSSRRDDVGSNYWVYSVFVHLDEAFGRTEGDEEIQDLLQGSQGLNIGLHFLSGALTFDPVITTIDADTASRVVWMDAFLTNVDRTVRNTNMLIWHKELWLIDHGATLYFHHSWTNWEKSAISPFIQIKDHVLLPYADKLQEADTELKKVLTPDVIRDIVNTIPDDWLNWDTETESKKDIREIYYNYLITRLQNSETFVKEAQHAKEILI